MIKALKKILGPYLTDKPLLLALSGGPDSMALFHLLNEMGVSFQCAHIDHSWRETSSKEAQWLKQLIPDLHLLTLKKSDFSGNLEKSARNLRYRFLKETALKIGADVILTAHHADDQAETVMKRLFEGVPPYSLKAISSVSDFEGLKLVRPLLNFTKQEILTWLRDRPYIVDETNKSSSFLRGRMREELIPYLNEKFGKNCSQVFGKLNTEIEELQAYIERQIEAKYKKLTGPFGSCLYLGEADPYELKTLVFRFLKEEGLPVQYALIDQIVQKRDQADLRFGDLILDRNVLFHVRSIPEVKETIKLGVGNNLFGSWQVRVEETKSDQIVGGWEPFWRGEIATYVDSLELWIGPAEKRANKHRSDSKIPYFLRVNCPIVYNDKGDIHDFLTPTKKNTNSRFRILLKFTSLC